MADKPLTIIIEDQKVYEILKEVGYPVVTLDVLPYTMDDLKNLFIWPAMRDYFKHFPIMHYSYIQAGGDFSVDFPTADTFDLVDARLNSNVETTPVPTGNPFVDSGQIITQGYSYSSGNKYGTRNNYGLPMTYHDNRAQYQGIKLAFAASRFNVDVQNRTVSGYVNVGGKVNFTWARYSNNFASIPFVKETDVLQLASSYLLRNFGNMMIMRASETNELDGATLVDRADVIEEKIITKWNETTKPVVIRNK